MICLRSVVVLVFCMVLPVRCQLLHAAGCSDAQMYGVPPENTDPSGSACWVPEAVSSSSRVRKIVYGLCTGHTRVFAAPVSQLWRACALHVFCHCSACVCLVCWTAFCLWSGYVLLAFCMCCACVVCVLPAFCSCAACVLPVVCLRSVVELVFYMVFACALPALARCWLQ